MQSLRKIFYLLDEKKYLLFIMVGFFVLIGLFDLITLYLIQPVISEFTGSEVNFKFVNFLEQLIGFELDIFGLVIILIIAFFLKFNAALFVNYIIVKFAQTHQAYTRMKLFKNISSKTVSEFQKSPITDYIYSVQVLAEQYTNNVLTPIMRSLSDLVIGSMVFGYLLYSSWELTVLVLLTFSISFIFYVSIFKGRLTLYGQTATQASADITSITTESFSGFRELTVFGGFSSISKRLHKFCIDYGNSFLKYTLVSTMPRYYFELIFSMLIGLMLLFFHMRDISSEDGFELLAVFILASMRLLPTMHQLSQLNLLLRFNDACMDRLLKLWSDKDQHRFMPQNSNFDHLKSLSIRLANVSFQYDVQIFGNVDCEFKPGEHIAITGPSGVGKSTLLDIIMGFVQPTQGSVIRKVNGSQVSPEVFWGDCAYIGQHSVVFSGTLKENLTMFSSEDKFDLQRAREAIRFAQLDDVFSGSSESFEFEIDQFGNNLSGGQKQRLSWARAYYSNASVIVVDEGTGALDEPTEIKLLKAISQKLSDRLVIFVTHKPERLNFFTCVLELSNTGLRVV